MPSPGQTSLHCACFACILLAQLDLSLNHLGAEGSKPLAEALRVNASVTKLLVANNKLGNEGAITLCRALRESTLSKVQELDFSFNSIGPDGAKAIAALCAAMGSLTTVGILQVTHTQPMFLRCLLADSLARRVARS